MTCGVQCAMMSGTAMMPPQCADNWDTLILVSYINNDLWHVHIVCYRYRDPNNESIFW